MSKNSGYNAELGPDQTSQTSFPESKDKNADSYWGDIESQEHMTEGEEHPGQ